MTLMTNFKLTEKKTFVCTNCSNPFARKDSLNRHMGTEGCNTEPIITPKQKICGLSDMIEQQLLEAGFIDAEHVGFRQDNFLVLEGSTYIIHVHVLCL